MLNKIKFTTMTKKIMNFIDGKLITYFFNDGKTISLRLHKHETKTNLYNCDVCWNWGKLQRESYGDEILGIYDTENKIKLAEIKLLYTHLKKQKHKTHDQKTMLSALMIINHDIKDEIFIQQSLF